MAIGLVAVLGLALVSGWVIRLAGIAGIIAFVLSVISLARIQDPSLPGDIGVGLWMLIAGSIVIVFAGFVPTTRIDRSTTATTA
jgi:phosphotransferase system  glucose/maltose/N-acetylglucosamine-specific IIC component